MIRRILQYKKKVTSTVNTFGKHNCYLNPGVYLSGGDLRYFYRNDPETIDFMENIILKNNYNLKQGFNISNIVKNVIVPKKIKVEEPTEYGNFKGTVYLLSNNSSLEKDIKIFSIERQEVLSIYVDRANLDKKINDFQWFSKYFSIPSIKSYDLDEKTSVEEFIVSKPKNEWNNRDYELVVSNIFKSYINYYSQYFKLNKLTYTSAKEKMVQIKNDPILQGLGEVIEAKISDDLISLDMPLAFQHGDLWLYNILLKNDKIYFIDWEHSGEYVFFYDLFWWMQNEAVYNKDSSYLSNYLAGNYDSSIKELFEAVNIKFNHRKRTSYFYLFMTEMLYKRVLDKNDSLKRTVIDLYSPLVREMDNY